jgi:hypothetical protein
VQGDIQWATTTSHGLANSLCVRQTVHMATEEDVRRIALRLPATSEKPSYGTPGFRVKDKLFARIRDGGELGVYCESEDEKFAMVTAEPAKFFTTSHFDGYAMVLVNLDAVDTDELTELLTEAWLLRAPAKLRAEFEARETSQPAAASHHLSEQTSKPPTATSTNKRKQKLDVTK